MRDAGDTDGEERQPEPWMESARFHPETGHVLVALSNGASLAFPSQAVPGLATATEADLVAVQVTGGGYVLRWPTLEVYLSYLGILTDVLGARAHMLHLARPKPKTGEERPGSILRRRPRR